MNYIGLINRFWIANEENLFRTVDIALYFYLLKVNNDCSWKETFKRNNKKVEVDLNISFNTLKDSRNRLKIAGLIFFKTVNGNANVAYSFSTTSSNIDKVTNEVSHEVSAEVCTRLVPSKDKLKETNKEREEEKIFTPEKIYFLDIEKIEDFLITDQGWCEVICMQNHLTLIQLENFIKSFIELLKSRGETGKTPNDAKSHFANWFKCEQSKKQKNGNNRRNLETTKSHASETL
jgi:hypothetical protein